MKRTKCLPLVLFVLLIGIGSARAKNLEGRLGAGAILPGFDGMGAFSVRYHPSPLYDIQGYFGFNTEDTLNATALGAQVHRNAYLEENMNFYIGLGGMIVADKGGNASVATGVEIQALLGAEFFFAGLSNLGFQFQTGVGLRLHHTNFLRTLGSGLSSVGVHYYF